MNKTNTPTAMAQWVMDDATGSVVVNDRIPIEGTSKT
jgi:hypothetical protein